ncbi:hypothetical protein PLEOSDRAFT_1088506 [Pleurotus ostreatus PC15]|uniref:Secreted protein n=1 Tax=Pleurotus ostreatus (strain PC15) TaxID=1137138 RepID=A0A067P2V5_PLEO1|nr:hypothetical protein PLEOSDRAFT_1088506 [Pleurotus ostreatus PC15]
MVIAGLLFVVASVAAALGPTAGVTGDALASGLGSLRDGDGASVDCSSSHLCTSSCDGWFFGEMGCFCDG